MSGFLIGENTAKPAGTVVKDTTTAHFQNDVMAESRSQPVLVDFWAPWCGPCKQLAPVLEKIVREAKGAVKLVKMNIDEHPSIAGQLGIRSIPAVVAFVDGRPADVLMGAVPESEIRAFVKKFAGRNAGAAVQEMLDALDVMMQQGQFAEAAKLYAQILKHDPKNVAAIAGLATCLFESGDVEKARALLADAPLDNRDDPRIRTVLARIELSEQVRQLGDPLTLEKTVAQNPGDYQARFDLALVYNAQGKQAAAADALLAIIQADRSWKDDAARRQLLQFFDAWGDKKPATQAARRKLSSLLFS